MDSLNQNEPRKIGNWIKISILGSGGFGTVTLWRCNTTHDTIAIKKCKLQCPTSLTEKQKERWWNEVEKMKELDHPNLVKYKSMPDFLEKELNKFNPTKLPLLPMEYCQKGNLRHILTQPLNLCGLTEETVKDILSDISEAVCYLHFKNITHRDIKPENIVLQDFPDRNTGLIYKLIDLGYAKELNSSTVSFVGTLHYLAPEIFANSDYDYTVDYWSLGVLAFEVICGILPFVPRLTPIQRYKLTKEKTSDHICVFLNHMGNVQFSSQLFKENKISTCLKAHMELWLKKALHFDPKLRAEPFPDNKNFFYELKQIINKKIVKVFVVNKYQFYSYEFDAHTKLSTLRQWIAKDTEISVEDQILLGNFQFDNKDDKTLVANCFIHENYELYLLKRNTLFDVDKHILPRLVKLMFEKATNKYMWHELKAIYAQCIYYIQQDIVLANAFSTVMDLYLGQLTKLNGTIHKMWETSRQKLTTLNGQIEHFNDELKITSETSPFVILAEKCLKLYDSIGKCLSEEQQLASNIQKWDMKVEAMKNINFKDNLIKLPQIDQFLQKAIICLQKTASNTEGSKEKLSCGEMLKIVSDVIRIKDNLLFNKNLKEYVRYMGKANDYLGSLYSWISSFNTFIDSLGEKFNLLMKDANEISRNLESDSKNRQSALTSSWISDEHIIKQSKMLNTRFEDLVSESIANYEMIRDDINNYIKDISLLLL